VRINGKLRQFSIDLNALFHKQLNTRKGKKMSATAIKFEELVNKYTVNPEEQDKAKKSQEAATNMRKKKSLAFAKVQAATDEEETAREAYERAVIEPGNTTFDALYLKLETAKATTKMYRQMYSELFGDVPNL
jgi:hypothetical protein